MHVVPRLCETDDFGTALHHDELRAFFVVLHVLRVKILFLLTRTLARGPGSRAIRDFSCLTLVGSIPGSSRVSGVSLNAR